MSLADLTSIGPLCSQRFVSNILPEYTVDPPSVSGNSRLLPLLVMRSKPPPPIPFVSAIQPKYNSVTSSVALAIATPVTNFPRGVPEEPGMPEKQNIMIWSEILVILPKVKYVKNNNNNNNNKKKKKRRTLSTPQSCQSIVAESFSFVESVYSVLALVVASL